jgi:hypothetical protein
MSWSKPYVSGLMEAQKLAAESAENRARIMAAIGGPIEPVKFYRHQRADYFRAGQIGDLWRIRAEEQWYADRRPYFRVYPLIERKLLALRGKTTLAEMRIPFPAIEINTQRRTMLIHKANDHCTLVAETHDELHVVMGAPMDLTLDEFASDGLDPVLWKGVSEQGKVIAAECLRIAIGVCLLATDPKIVAPVILDKHRRDDMRPDEIERRAAQAVSRTGRIGFDVGRDIERMPVTSHYRTGCPAIYHVGKSHESYPRGGVLDREPVLLWRSGAVVNADRTVRVPTGFHGAAASD